MPSVGLKHIVMAKLSEVTGVPVYTEGIIFAEAMKVDTKWDKSDASVRSDDRLSDVDTSVTGGKQSLEVNDIILAKQAYALGHSYTEADGLIEAEGDIAPYVGHGYYGKSILNGVKSYKAIWIYKTQFAQPDDSMETKGEKPKFVTPKIEGTIMEAVNSRFRNIKEFPTEAEAIAWLDGMAGVKLQCAAPVASVASGSYATAQSVTLTSTEGATIHYTTNGLTPTATSPTYSTAIAVSDDMAIKAIAIKDGCSNSSVATYEYIITT